MTCIPPTVTPPPYAAIAHYVCPSGSVLPGNICQTPYPATANYGCPPNLTRNGLLCVSGTVIANSDAAIAPRTTSSTYDARGQFAISTSNALGHTETRDFDARFGVITRLTGPNAASGTTDPNFTTNWHYDTFGRKIQESRADGTQTTWSYQPTCPLAPASATLSGTIGYCIVTTQSATGQTSYAPGYAYYDTLNRNVLNSRRNFANNDWIDEGNTWYDGWGRAVKTYLPYERLSFSTAQSASMGYDILNRPATQTAPDLSITTFAYNGLTTSVTNDLKQTKTTVKNSQGQTVTVTDALNNNVSYAYDSFGNLTTTTDALFNVTTLTYDTRGRKIGMTDPDMGNWTYAYDALGELVRQIDAKGQTVTMQYDLLGRMTARNEPDLISTWVYDTASHGIGKIASVSSGNGYLRTYTYDTLGRTSGISYVIDNTSSPYVTSTTYDAYSRIYTRTDPTGFAVKNNYNANGYLSSVVNASPVITATTPSTVYAAAGTLTLWQANTMDAAGHLTQQTYGNKVVTNQVFEPATGRVHQQQAGTDTSNAAQNMSYTYDTLGNLKIRNDANSNLMETYHYDTLNRLDTATALSGAINATTSYAYDAIGNILCKSDISACSASAANYTYNASGTNSVRPHAVSQINGSVNGASNPVYTYDANGNMLTGAGRTATWTSFNLPYQIVSGGNTDGFLKFYDPDHARTEELQSDGSLVIVINPRYDTGGHFEKKYVAANGQLTGAVEYEHYLYAGGMMFGSYTTATQTDGVTVATVAFEYYSKDDLGSIVAITDATGAVVQHLSYDPWGKRRYSSGAADPNGLLLTNPDMYHGFTGHEMLDSVALIHMNGRVYDPATGRFLSPDPNIQSPGNLQSYNRYAYVWDNPLSATDPSGYLKIFGINITPRVIVAAVAAFYTGGAVNAWMMDGALAAGPITAAAYSTASITAGIAGGATAGFSGSMVMTNGNVGISLQGAVGGAIGGGVSGYFGSSYPFERVVANSFAGGIQSELQGGSFSDGARMSFEFSALAYLNSQMRDQMIEQSKLDPRNDGTGLSRGMFGDMFKLAGGRWDPFANGVQCSLLGCMQNGSGSVLGISYNKGGFIDMIVESFAGPHDTANSVWYYDSNGLIKNMAGTNVLALDLATNYTTSLMFAAPFAAGAIYEQTSSGAYLKALNR